MFNSHAIGPGIIFSLTDLMNITKACLCSSVLVVTTILFVFRFQGFSRTVFVMDGLLAFLFIAGFRVGIRLYFQKTTPFSLNFAKNEAQDRKKNLLIIGAGDAAEKVLREIHDNHLLPYRVVGLLDDDSSKVGRMIHSIRILGRIDDLVKITENNVCRELLIAVPSADRKQMTRMVDLCQATALLFLPYIKWRYGVRRPTLGALFRYSLISGALVAFFWLMFLSLRFTSALNTSVIFTLVPGISGIYSAILLKERLGRYRLTALLPAMITFFLTQIATLSLGPTRVMAYSYLYPAAGSLYRLADGPRPAVPAHHVRHRPDPAGHDADCSTRSRFR